MIKTFSRNEIELFRVQFVLFGFFCPSVSAVQVLFRSLSSSKWHIRFKSLWRRVRKSLSVYLILGRCQRAVRQNVIICAVPRGQRSLFTPAVSQWLFKQGHDHMNTSPPPPPLSDDRKGNMKLCFHTWDRVTRPHYAASSYAAGWRCLRLHQVRKSRLTSRFNESSTAREHTHGEREEKWLFN